MTNANNARKKPAVTNAFLQAADQRNAENIRDTDARSQRVRDTQKEADTHVRWQEEFFRQHLAPVIDSLTGLPRVDNRFFTTDTRFSQIPVSAPRMTVGIDYQGGRRRPGWEQSTRHGAADLSDSLFIVMQQFNDENDFVANLWRRDRISQADHREHLKIFAYNVAELQQEIGRFVADVAPDRIAMLKAAAKASPAPKAPKPPSR